MNITLFFFSLTQDDSSTSVSIRRRQSKLWRVIHFLLLLNTLLGLAAREGNEF